MFELVSTVSTVALFLLAAFLFWIFGDGDTGTAWKTAGKLLDEKHELQRQLDANARRHASEILTLKTEKAALQARIQRVQSALADDPPPCSDEEE